jgi:hypothetical protein
VWTVGVTARVIQDAAVAAQFVHCTRRPPSAIVRPQRAISRMTPRWVGDGRYSSLYALWYARTMWASEAVREGVAE